MDLNILRKEIKQKRLSLDYQKFELYNLEINNTIINSKIRGTIHFVCKWIAKFIIAVKLFTAIVV
mgnify:CR=1 FL=1